jgi:hypothetical protein
VKFAGKGKDRHAQEKEGNQTSSDESFHACTFCLGLGSSKSKSKRVRLRIAYGADRRPRFSGS